MTAASLQPKWLDAFLRAATGIRSVECASHKMSLYLCSKVSFRIVFSVLIAHLRRLAPDSFPMDAEIDLEAFSNDIPESASGWGGTALDADTCKRFFSVSSSMSLFA
jgi:hypothetical protein